MRRRLTVFGFMTATAILRPPGAPSAEQDVAATIVNSGSTNRPGFRIVVNRSGVAEFTSAPREFVAQPNQSTPILRTLPRSLVEALFSDLEAAKPLDSLPPVHCAKSVSLGTTLIVVFGEKQTPDLSCGDGGNPVMRNLIRDTDQIVALIRTDVSAPESGVK